MCSIFIHMCAFYVAIHHCLFHTQDNMYIIYYIYIGKNTKYLVNIYQVK